MGVLKLHKAFNLFFAVEEIIVILFQNTTYTGSPGVVYEHALLRLCTLVPPRGLTIATKFLQQKDFLKRPLQLLSVKPRGGGKLKYTTTVNASYISLFY